MPRNLRVTGIGGGLDSGILCSGINTVKTDVTIEKIDRWISARPSVAQIWQKSCGNPPIEHPSGTHPAMPRQI